MSSRSLLPPPAHRWNFAAIGLDFTLFTLGLSFASTSVVLPLFVSNLTPSNLALGLIPAVHAAGVLFPPLLAAAHTERLPLKKPFILVWGLLERLPYLALAVLTPLLAASRPGLLLWVFFGLLAAGHLSAGVGLSAWLDLVARAIPEGWRGRFFGWFAALGGLLGVGGSAVAAAVLARLGWPDGYALLFAATFACYLASYAGLVAMREPPPTPRVHGSVHRRGSPVAVLRTDRDFARYLAASGLLAAAGAGGAFYAAAAERRFALGDAGAGLYAVALLAATTLGNLAWGSLGDRRGRKRVVEGGALCTGLAAALALLALGAPWGALGFVGVFVLLGLGASALGLGALTVATDFAPEEARPTYIGLASAARAPFAVAAPLLGGLLADGAGYPAVFAATAVAAAAGGLLVWRGVRDPRAADRAPLFVPPAGEGAG